MRHADAIGKTERLMGTVHVVGRSFYFIVRSVKKLWTGDLRYGDRIEFHHRVELKFDATEDGL